MIQRLTICRWTTKLFNVGKINDLKSAHCQIFQINHSINNKHLQTTSCMRKSDLILKHEKWDVSAERHWLNQSFGRNCPSMWPEEPRQLCFSSIEQLHAAQHGVAMQLSSSLSSVVIHALHQPSGVFGLRHQTVTSSLLAKFIHRRTQAQLCHIGGWNNFSALSIECA